MHFALRWYRAHVLPNAASSLACARNRRTHGLRCGRDDRIVRDGADDRRLRDDARIGIDTIVRLHAVVRIDSVVRRESG